MLGNLKWFLNHIIFWKKIVIKVNTGVGRRRNQMCNLSSIKQFIFLHWVQPTNLNCKDLVSKELCLKKEPYHVPEKGQQQECLHDLDSILPLHVPFQWLKICSYDAPYAGKVKCCVFLKLSVLCYASYEGTCFCLFSITQRKSTMKLQSSENLYEQFSSRLFHTCNFIMKEEVQFSPTKNSMQVSGWGQKFPTWKFPTWGPLQRSTSFLISQLQPLTPAYE